jgi:polyisoprenoid-binding protein YceI
MKKIGLLVLISASAFGQKSIDFEQFFPIDRGHSFIEFSITYMGYAKMKGRFADFSGMVRYDEKNPEDLSVSLGIKTESIDTDNDFRDNDLKSDNWFDAKTFPLITFSSKKFRKGKNGFELVGDLTIKGITKEIILKMEAPSGVLKDARQDHQVIFTGTTTLDRTDFKVEGKNWSAVKEGITAVGNLVIIDFSILGKQVKAANWTNRVKNAESPQGKIYKVMKEQGVAQAMEAFRSIKASGESLDKNILSTVGTMLSLEGNRKDALTFYEANREAFPEAPEVYYDLGEAYGLLGDMDKSKASFQQALKLNPGYFWAIEVLRHF